jgi:hypothetical protein
VAGTYTKVTVDAKGRTTVGASATKSDVGLSNVDNTSDANKPVSTATQTALNLKANLDSPALTGTPTAPTASAGTNTTQVATTAFTLANRGDRYLTTSTSSHSITTGSKTFTVQSGLSYTPTQDVTIVYDAARHMHAFVTSYSGTELVVNVDTVEGSGGPFTAWTINVGGLISAQGALLEANNLSDVANPATALANIGGVPTSRTIGAGTGLTGGGDLTANRTLTVSYGTTAGTACEGNDARLSDARTPLSHVHAASDVTSGVFDNARINFAAPAAIGNTTPAAGNFTTFTLKDSTGGEVATFDAQNKLSANRTYDLPDRSGVIALAADNFDFDYSTTTSNATGGSGTWTWTIPANAKLLRFWVVSGGGGGGSGRRGAAGTNRTGGAGGHSAAVSDVWYAASSLTSPLTVTVGAGGAGGAAQTVDDTNGNNGTLGGNSSVVCTGVNILVSPNAGAVMRGGIEGTATAAAGGNSLQGAMLQIDVGATGTNGAGTSRQNLSALGAFLTGGSGGGGINSSNVAGAGGNNFQGTMTYLFGSAVGGGGGANTGGNGGSSAANGAILGGSGSGGGANLTGAGGNGGNGYRGGGGGGGGASVNGNNSGAGGNGGNGFVRISVFY